MTRRALLACLALLGLLSGCGNDGPTRFQNTDLSQGGLTPALTLTDDQGRPRTLSEFQGKVVLVIFGFTSCPDICPTTLRKYATLLRNMPTRDADRIQVLFITLDPVRDTPEVLGKYVRWFNPSFLPLTGSESQIADVARIFHVNYSKKSIEGRMGYTLDHSTGAYAIDPAGRLRLHLGEHALIEPIAADLRMLLAGK